MPTYRNRLLPPPAVAIVLLSVLPCRAEKSLRFLKHDIDVAGNEACTFGDFNRDAKTDIACGNRWYRNPTWAQQTIPSGADFMASMDVDADGLDDIILGEQGSASWSRNLGGGTSWGPGGDLGVGGQHSGNLWDVDGDGKAREVVSGSQGATYWSEFIGGKWVSHLVSNSLSNYGSGVGDINGDGRPDILRPNFWYEAPSDPRNGNWIQHEAAFGAIEEKPASNIINIKWDHPYWEWNNALGICGHTVQMYAMDVDGDGLRDIIASSGHRMGVMWYRQVRKGTSIGFQPEIVDGSVSEVHTLEMADLDKDGDLDLVAGKRWRGHAAYEDPLSEDPLFVFWYEHVPKRPFWKRHIISYGENIGAGMKIGLADYDKDGDVDMVVSAKRQEGRGGGPFLFENRYPETWDEPGPGPGAAFTFTKKKIDSRTNLTCLFADLDKDGKLDIVGGDFWYRAPDWTPQKFRSLTDDGFSASLDVDEDGFVDIITGSYQKGLSWWRNPGSGNGLWAETVVDPDGNYENGLLWDVDGDKRAREVVSSSYGKNVVWWEVNKGKWTSHLVSTLSCNFGAGVGDVNGDGRPDIIRPNAWFEAPSDPRSGTWKPHEIAIGAIDDRALAVMRAPMWLGTNTKGRHGHTAQIHVFDVNKDGRNDLIASSAHRVGIFWYEQTAAGEFLRRTIDATWSQAHGLLFQDMDGDGDPDLVTGKCYHAQDTLDPQSENPLQVVWYELSPGMTQPWVKHEITYGEGIGAGFTFGVADINGDKDMDIVVTGKFGGPWLLENQSSVTSRVPVKNSRLARPLGIPLFDGSKMLIHAGTEDVKDLRGKRIQPGMRP